MVGIAGPGDTLATGFALETFRIIKKEFPNLIRCMSTNGLLLADKADEVVEAGIDTLTVTVNAVDPEIEAQLNNRIIYHGKIYTGVEAAQILIENQLAGIEKVSSRGVLVKVNTVLVPKINGNHIEEIACCVKDAGASIYNLIPLIPQNELKDLPAPTYEEIDAARKAAYPYINFFNHCAHCRRMQLAFLVNTTLERRFLAKRCLQKKLFPTDKMNKRRKCNFFNFFNGEMNGKIQGCGGFQ